MSEQDIASRVVTELGRTADQTAASATALVSLTLDMIESAALGAVETSVIRKTRTLIFLRADVRGPDGSLIASASSVHKISA